MITLPTVWVYKNNNHDDKGGDWDEFFAPFQERAWGRSWVTNKPDGKRIVCEEMSPGDMVICWQTDRRAVAGLASVVEVRHLDDGDAELILKPEVVYNPQIRLLDDKKSDPQLASVSAFKQGNAGTFYRTTREEAKVLVQRLGLFPDADELQ